MPLYLGLALGVTTVSFSAILIRLAEAPPLVIAAYRLVVASAVILPVAAVTTRPLHRSLNAATLRLSALSGIFLAMHFALWITSLSYTSVASSVVLVTTSPLIVALLSPLFTRDIVTRSTLIGILTASAGVVAITWGNLAFFRQAFYGDLLALAGAVAVAGYLIAGRRLMRELPLLPYLSVVYTSAALALILLATLGGHSPWGYSNASYLFMIMLGLGPQVVGHSLLIWTLKRLSAISVSVAVMAEPVVAIALAWLLLGEAPTLPEVAGGALILAGVRLALRQSGLVQDNSQS